MVRSGKLNVRLPADLHEALAEQSERQGVSLNTLIVSLLAGGIGWKPVDQADKQVGPRRHKRPAPDTRGGPDAVEDPNR